MIDVRLVLFPACAAVLGLAGCQDSSGEPPAEQDSMASAEPLDDPAVAQPATSIIRADLAVEPVIVLPPEPLELTVHFEEGTALSEAAERQLAGVLQSEALAEGWPVVLRGHSDAGGSDAANLRVSRQRAETVADWLLERGVAEDRIRIIAFGEQNPVARNAELDGTPYEAGRARNRRVEVTVSPAGAKMPEAEGGAVSENAVAEGADGSAL